MSSTWSFSRQIRATVVGTATLAVIFAVIVAFFIVAFLNRSAAGERAQTLAALLANTAPATLSLGDRERATELLTAFSASKNVRATRIVDANGTVLSEYLRTGQRSTPELFNHATADTQVAKAQVRYENENLGSVELAVDAEFLSEMSIFFLLAAMGVIGVLLLAIWAIAGPLEKRLSRPIIALSVFTRRVRDSKDYSLRLPLSQIKELRGLTEDLNEMLGVIEKANAEQAERSHQLAKLAFYDQLTGAANRSLFRDRLSQCVADYHQKRTPFSLIGIDLDHFKQLNDKFGHAAGDEYLREASRLCMALLRPTDTFARMGGDEFIVILPNMERVADAIAVAEKLSGALKAANKAHGQDTKCTGSIGVGLFPYDADTPALLMKRVDQAMYQAKSNGRDQIVPVNASPPAPVDRPQPIQSIYTRLS